MLLTHLPAKPPYLRVKIWRRLQALGAQSLKNAAWVLPLNEEAREDFEWLAREIGEAGGDASICETRFVDRTTDASLVDAFNAAREADYAALAASIQADKEGATSRETWANALAKIAAIDFFNAPGREIVSGLLRAEASVSPRKGETKMQTPKCWVTRADIHVDRIASAWLIGRFIDPAAQFKFVRQRDYKPAPGEARFDMFEGEYTHRGDHCTFEVLMADFGLGDPALAAVGQIIHDLDLKDEKYGRPETAGVAALLQGLNAIEDDHERLRRGRDLFDGLYASFGGGK